jgi:hypothetical protein
MLLLSQVAMGAVHHVSIIDDAFVPQRDTIAFGDTVTWTNNGAITHTTTSTGGLWDSGFMSHGATFSHHFTSNGSFPYECSIHLFTGTIVVLSSDVKDETGNRDNPFEFDLSQNYPNPFNQSTKIDFVLKQSGLTTLMIYDLLGRKVKTLVEEELSSGYKSVLWDGKNDSGENVGSGVYFYRLKVTSSFSNGTGDFSETRKLLLLK